MLNIQGLLRLRHRVISKVRFCAMITPSADLPAPRHPPLMKTPIAFWSILGILLRTLSPESNAQALPGNLSFSVSGAFENAVGQGTQSLLIIDNDLTDGHRPEMTL